MSIVLALLITVIIYVKSFKDDFQAEAISKVSSALIVIVIFCVLYMLLASITN